MGVPAGTDFVLITAKRLDSEEAEDVAIEVGIPETELGQRSQLMELVHARYPEAEFRSFANEAASFLAHKLLVVAVYRRSATAEQLDRAPEDDAQEQLFAA